MLLLPCCYEKHAALRLAGRAAPGRALGPGSKELTYTVDIDPKVSTNEFRVRLQLPKLKKDQAVYQFASTAPGTYQVMDMGRFVSNFQAFDGKGKPLGAKQVSKTSGNWSAPTKRAKSATPLPKPGTPR
ncbi:M61 family metallopeptidase [Hymenobacter oligotrophus]|uniref:M61 family metallopeptidase n=1 Tax=Hymenobacter oligotrophus TaxID=2319843 RepID=UPI0021D253A8|nr:hypothetical protein [Hymenobacter oligotrophus]